MFIKSIIRTVVASLALCVVLSQASTAQSMRADDPCVQAEAEGSRESTSCLWFGVGYCLPFIGPISAYIIKPEPPASVFVGKSPAYLDLYIDCYKSGAVSNQAKWAWIGTCSCLVSIPLLLVGSCVTGIGGLSKGPG